MCWRFLTLEGERADCQTDLGQDEVPQPADTVHVVPVDVPGGEVWEMDLLGDKGPGDEEKVRRRQGGKREEVP